MSWFHMLKRFLCFLHFSGPRTKSKCIKVSVAAHGSSSLLPLVCTKCWCIAGGGCGGHGGHGGHGHGGHGHGGHSHGHGCPGKSNHGHGGGCHKKKRRHKRGHKHAKCHKKGKDCHGVRLNRTWIWFRIQRNSKVWNLITTKPCYWSYWLVLSGCLTCNNIRFESSKVRLFLSVASLWLSLKHTKL